MRFSILIVFFALPLLLFSQYEGVISVKEHNILYRGYNNYIEVGLRAYCDDSIWLECSNCESIEWKSHLTYIVKPHDQRYTTLSILAFDGDRVFTISSKEFSVRDLPDPEIMFNGYWSYEKFSISELVKNLKRPIYSNDPPSTKIRTPRVYAQYSPERTMEAKFSVKDWCIQIQKEKFKGKGPSTNRDLLNYLMNLKFTEPVYMKVEMEALEPDGKLRLISSVFEIVS